MRFQKHLSVLIFGLAIPLLTACGDKADQPTAPSKSSAPAASSESTPVYDLENATWPQDASDLTPDPAITYGQLENGMRYIIMANDTPEETVALRLRIDAGSLNERDDQRGISHFLEHMAFNGSTNVPEGEMIKILERHGLAFGPDTNAFTSFDQVQYQLCLLYTSPSPRDQRGSRMPSSA